VLVLLVVLMSLIYRAGYRIVGVQEAVIYKGLVVCSVLKNVYAGFAKIY